MSLCLGSEVDPRELDVFLWARYPCREFGLTVDLPVDRARSTGPTTDRLFSYLERLWKDRSTPRRFIVIYIIQP